MGKISFVIPVYNEEENIPVLSAQLKSELKKLPYQYEIIFINDGSTDQTLKVLQQLEKKDSHLKIISFRKNLGKADALNEGFLTASGDFVITMDGDLQDGPENIPDLISKLDEGFDMVVGWKKERHDPLGKRLPSKIFNLVVGNFTGLHLHDFNCGLKIMKKEVAREIYLYGDMHRFIPVLAHQRGFKVTEIPVAHHPRRFGSSKYGWARLIKGYLDLLTVLFLGKYSQRPLQFFGVLGMGGIVVGIILGVYLSVLHFGGESIGRRPLLILMMLLIITGLQLLSIGLMAEMAVSRSKKGENLPIDYESR